MAEWQRWKGIMKCVPFEESRLAKWPPPYIVQPKYDGVRCRAIPLETGPKGDETLLVSSEENIIYSVPHINRTITGLKLRAELDGELYCHGMSFDQILSITSRTVNLHPDRALIKFHIFDVVNEQPQMRRQLLVEALRGLHPWLEIAPFWLCESLDSVTRTYDHLITLGYEGIIVRHNMAPYERKRSTMIMKFKPHQSDIYKIVGTIEEVDKEGNTKNSLGALTCESGDGNLFNVGTGFTDEQRSKLWDIKNTLPGMSVEIKYQHLTSGKKVPRFPVFVEVKADD
jgi:DNA ligase-1